MKKLLIIFLFATFALNATEASERKFKGKHSLGSYHECDLTALYDTESLRSAFFLAIEASGGHTISFVEQTFDKGAYTHPEQKSVFVDLFTEGNTCDPKPFHHALIEYLRPALSNMNQIERG